ncbi:hypothetical protein L1987_21569 [Smallanthus sonchifolius]|uniref:Uncharacterized protein n=1 Tax=Smallanthus sonchifolius TaxID=185202 RepID=A0ACB9IUQ4_9ASTR|nr:hypothetical protein L1987_21569 [Smallanthus sonchifolius]
MNPVTDQPPPPPPSFSCDRHPEDSLTGLCPSCLRERLTILDHSSSSSTTTAAATKSGDVRHPNLMSIDDENKPLHNVNNYERDEIRVSEDEEITNLNDLENDIVEMEAKIDAIVNNLKSIKDQIDRDAHSKKPSSSNFWSTASVWNKKWQNWRRKHKKNVVDRNGVVSKTTLPAAKPNPRPYHETQSEVGDYGFGRRSCDTGPRFSLDAGRVSFDEPPARGSWDGYLIGRSFPKLPPMGGDVNIHMRIPLEEAEGNINIPGGSTQTREYYLNSSSRRRKGLDRSNSMNAKVSPASIDYSLIRGGRVKCHSIGGEKELERDSNSNSNSVRVKKGRWWNWKVWRLINRQTANEKECSDELRSTRVRRSNSSSINNPLEIDLRSAKLLLVMGSPIHNSSVLTHPLCLSNFSLVDWHPQHTNNHRMPCVPNQSRESPLFEIAIHWPQVPPQKHHTSLTRYCVILT